MGPGRLQVVVADVPSVSGRSALLEHYEATLGGPTGVMGFPATGEGGSRPPGRLLISAKPTPTALVLAQHAVTPTALRSMMHGAPCCAQAPPH